MKRILFPLLALALILTAAVSSASGYVVTVNTDSQAYVGAASIHLSGQVSPAPGPGTAVLIRIFNPNKVMVTADEAQVNGTTGNYSDVIVASGSSSWVGGQYLVNVTWGAYPPVVYVTTAFSWTSAAVTTTSQTTSTTSSSTTTTSSSATHTTSTSSPSTSTVSQLTTTSMPATTSTSTQSPTSSTSSSGGGGGIPEFPFGALAVGLATVLVVVSYLAIRGRGRGNIGTGSVSPPIIA